MGKYVDYYFENNRLQKLVDRIIKKRYGWIPQKDYDDFYSVAGQALWYCEEHFDITKGKNFEKYLIDSCYRKIKTQITRMNRKKRNNGEPDVSMEKLIDAESETTFGDMIAAKEADDIHPLAQRYVDSLSKKQRQIAELIMRGYDSYSIKKKLGLTDEKFKILCQRMRAEDKIEPLKKLRGEQKWKNLQ